jgi:hypothetical protein
MKALSERPDCGHCPEAETSDEYDSVNSRSDEGTMTMT